MAPKQGLEPWITVLETVVLPLHYFGKVAREGNVRERTRTSNNYHLKVARLPIAPHGLGSGARIRTQEWRDQNPLPYHLATPDYLARGQSFGSESNRRMKVLQTFALPLGYRNGVVDEI
jgi:hypothetical protein